MSIVAGDIKFYLNGGAANADPNASLGGTISATQVSGSLHGLFDAVGSDEASAGDIEYRALDVKNTSAETANNAVVYISSQTSSADTSIEIAYDSTGTQTIANESTAPTGVTFSAPATKATGISLGSIAAGGTRRIWIKRVVTAGAVKTASDACELTVAVDTV